MTHLNINDPIDQFMTADIIALRNSSFFYWLSEIKLKFGNQSIFVLFSGSHVMITQLAENKKLAKIYDIDGNYMGNSTYNASNFSKFESTNLLCDYMLVHKVLCE